MAKIRFENGTVVNFQGQPTAQDVEEVANKLGLNSRRPATPAGFEGSRTPEADARSAEQYGAAFPLVTGKDNPLTAGLKAAGNLPGSAYNLGRNVLSAGVNVLNPNLEKNTLANLAKIGAGGVQKLIPGKQGQEEQFDLLTSALKERYGSIDNLARTATNDPFAFGAEILAALEGGAALVGKQQQLNSALSKVAQKGVIQPVKKAFDSVTNTTFNTVSPVEQGVRAVLNPAENVPAQTKNVGMTVAEQQAKIQKLDKYLKQAEKSVKDFSQESSLELAGRQAEAALRILNDKLKKQGALKGAETAKLANKSMADSISVARETLKQRVGEVLGGNLDDAGNLTASTGRKIAISDRADMALLKQVSNKLDDLAKSPTFRAVDDVIDSIDDILFKRSAQGAVPINSKVEGIVKSVIQELNNDLKVIGGKTYSTANNKYAYFVKARNQLNKALGIDANKGGALMKRVFSPTDGGTKKLFADIKKLTGIDLVEEATLAKFSMEMAGDFRRLSLLEIMPSSPSGALKSAVNALIKKAINPADAARRIVKKAPIKK